MILLASREGGFELRDILVTKAQMGPGFGRFLRHGMLSRKSVSGMITLYIMSKL